MHELENHKHLVRAIRDVEREESDEVRAVVRAEEIKRDTAIEVARIRAQALVQSVMWAGLTAVGITAVVVLRTDSAPVLAISAIVMGVVGFRRKSG